MSNLPENQIIPKQLFYEKFYKMSFLIIWIKLDCFSHSERKQIIAPSSLKCPGEITGAWRQKILAFLFPDISDEKRILLKYSKIKRILYSLDVNPPNEMIWYDRKAIIEFYKVNFNVWRTFLKCSWNSIDSVSEYQSKVNNSSTNLQIFR